MHIGSGMADNLQCSNLRTDLKTMLNVFGIKPGSGKDAWIAVIYPFECQSRSSFLRGMNMSATAHPPVMIKQIII